MTFSSPHSSSGISPWGQPEVGLLASLYANQHQLYYTFENLIPLGALTLLVLILTEHVTGQFKLLILVAPCLIDVPWLLKVLKMLEHILHQCPIIKDLVKDDSVG